MSVIYTIYISLYFKPTHQTPIKTSPFKRSNYTALVNNASQLSLSHYGENWFINLGVKQNLIQSFAQPITHDLSMWSYVRKRERFKQLRKRARHFALGYKGTPIWTYVICTSLYVTTTSQNEKKNECIFRFAHFCVYMACVCVWMVVDEYEEKKNTNKIPDLHLSEHHPCVRIPEVRAQTGTIDNCVQ